MQLKLNHILQSPLGNHLRLAYVLESQGAFLLGDRNKVVLLRANGSLELIANLDEDQYQWKGIGVDFLNEIMQKSVNGFKLLSRDEQTRFTQSEIYNSTRDIPVANYGHDGALLFFSGKSIALLKWNEEQLVELKRIKTKGKQPMERALSPQQNLLLYGTNHGELYSQTFNRDQFLKSSKIDQLPNTCYQITFSPDGRQLLVGGLGFIKIYNFDCNKFTCDSSITTAMRSFELVEDYLFVNKGMHGMDVIRIKDKPERVTSLDLPFMIDEMYYLAPQKTFLLISGSTNEWALLSWT
jgi:hypothetical protein